MQLLPWKNYFYTGLGSFLQSSPQNIQLQTNLGGGIGRYLKNTNNTVIAIIGGLAWQNTNYKQSPTSVPAENVGAALLSAEFQFFRFNKTNLNITANAFPALTEPGRIFIVSVRSLPPVLPAKSARSSPEA